MRPGRFRPVTPKLRVRRGFEGDVKHLPRPVLVAPVVLLLLFVAQAPARAALPRGFEAQWANTDQALPGAPGVSASSITVGPDGSVYQLVPSMGRILHQNVDGAFLESWSVGQTSGGAQADIAVLHDGRVAVTDPTHDLVLLFTPHGSPAGSWGGGANGLSFADPQGIAVSPTGQVGVWDASGTQILNPDGSFVRAIANERIAAGSLHMGLGASDLYTVFPPAVSPGSAPTQVIRWTPDGRNPTFFSEPKSQDNQQIGLDVDQDGLVWLGDANSRTATALRADGSILEACSLERRPYQAIAPIDAAVGPDGAVVATAGNQVVKLGPDNVGGAKTCSPPTLSNLVVTPRRPTTLTRSLRVNVRASDGGDLYTRLDTLRLTNRCRVRPGPGCVLKRGQVRIGRPGAPNLSVRLPLPRSHRSARYRLLVEIRDDLGRRSDQLSRVIYVSATAVRR